MSPKARESVITSVVLLIIYGFLFAQTMGMPSTPALFPRVCLILLTVLTVIMLYLDVRKYAKDHDAESGVHWKEIAVPLVAFAAIVVYAVLLDLFGYFPATAVMLVGFMIALKVKPWWLILAITAVYALFIYLMFVVWLRVGIIEEGRSQDVVDTDATERSGAAVHLGLPVGFDYRCGGRHDCRSPAGPVCVHGGCSAGASDF